MKFEKWVTFREQAESRNEIERTLKDANAAIDQAFRFLLGTIKKSYGSGGQAMHSKMRDTLLADLREIMRKVASFESRVAAEATELIDKAVRLVEQEDPSAQKLGITGRNVGGQRVYSLEAVLNSIRDKIKSMMQFVVNKIADIKMAGATGKTARELARLRGRTASDIAGVGRQVGDIPGQITPGIEKIGGQMSELPGEIAKASRPPITHDEASNISSGIQAIGGELRSLRSSGYIDKETASQIRFYATPKGGQPIEMARKDRSPVYLYNPNNDAHHNKLQGVAHENYGILYLQIPGIPKRIPMDLKSVHAADKAMDDIRQALGSATKIPSGMYHGRGEESPIPVSPEALEKIMPASERGYGKR